MILLHQRPTRTLCSSSTKMSPRVLLFGTGSVGGTYGYVLSKALGDNNLLAICRSNYEAALANGFTLNSRAWGHHLKYKPHVVRNADEAASLGPFDYIIITSKILPGATSTAQLLKPVMSKETAIVLIQNGINIEAPYTTAFPNNPILSCVTYLFVNQPSPAVIEHTELERLNIGTYPAHGVPESHKAAAESFAELIKAGGATANVFDDVQPERWTKLLANATWNPICALSRSRDVQFLHSSPEAWRYIRDTMREVASIARAEGHNVTDENVDKTLSMAQARSLPGMEPSMQADALAGRAMEVDAIVGNAVRIAEKRGVDVPLLRGVWAMIKALDDSLRRERERGK